MLRFLTLVSAFLFTATTASAETLTMTYSDRELSGQTTINLTRDLQGAFPYLRTSGRIYGVTIKAKSEHGRGEAYLWIDGTTSTASRIDGNPRDFYNSSDWTFDTLTVNSPSSGWRDDWNLVLQGHIILREITVHFDSTGAGPGGGHGGPRPPEYTRYENLDCHGGISPCYPSGRIVRARLAREFSRGECILDHTWGVREDYIWTSGYCHASFEVEVTRH